MSRVSRRANTKTTKARQGAYRRWRIASGMRDHDAERAAKLAKRAGKAAA